MDIQFAGQFHHATKDGVSISTPVRLSDACLAVGIPLNLGKRRVQATLAVPWDFYRQDKAATGLPSLSFGAHNLGDLAYPRTLGKELTVHDFDVTLGCESQVACQGGHALVAVTARMEYQPSLGGEWDRNMADVTPPPAQELLLQGHVGHGGATSNLEFMVTSKGAKRVHTWEKAFGEPNVVLHKAKLVLEMAGGELHDKSHHGAKRVDVVGNYYSFTTK
jgi:hypothetical protein